MSPIPASKSQLLNAAMNVFRAAGYSATTVEDICRAAGVTKGSFFHHFKSKEELALASIAHWELTTEALFAGAAYQRASDPLQRLLGYVDFRAQILQGAVADFTCLLGTLVQETYDTHPQIRAACERSLARHIAALAADIAAAKLQHAPTAPWSAESVGYYVQSVLQGSFIFAKAQQSPDIVRHNLEHLRGHLQTLFNVTSALH